jgi:hypothetical protein
MNVELMAPEVVAPCDLNLYIFISFHGPCANKKRIIMNHKMKKNWIYIFSYVHLSSTTTKHFSQKTLKPKCGDKNYKKIQNFKLKSEINSKTFLIFSI